MFKYFVGVDIVPIEIGKSFSAAIIERKEKLICQFNANMDEAGFEKLINTIPQNKEEVIIGMESSGSYHLNLFYFLQQKGYKVVLINPLIVANFAKLSLRKCKTDRKDAYIIARVLFMQEIKNAHFDQGLKELTREREYLTHEIAKIKNEIKRLIHILFPELEYKCFIFSDTCLYMLSCYPSANSIANATIFDIKKALKRKIKITAEEIINMAKNSIGVNNKALEKVLVSKIKMFRAVEESLKEITETIKNEAESLFSREISILTSIDGIDVISSSHFLAEIGDISHFYSYKKLIAYAGVDPLTHQSGKFEGRSKISKRGNRHLRRILWIMAVNVIFNNAHFRAYFVKKIREGKSYKAAVMCVIHKLIRVIYSMLTNRTHFIYPKEVLCQNFS